MKIMDLFACILLVWISLMSHNFSHRSLLDDSAYLEKITF